MKLCAACNLSYSEPIDSCATCYGPLIYRAAPEAQAPIVGRYSALKSYLGLFTGVGHVCLVGSAIVVAYGAYRYLTAMAWQETMFAIGTGVSLGLSALALYAASQFGWVFIDMEASLRRIDEKLERN